MVMKITAPVIRKLMGNLQLRTKKNIRHLEVAMCILFCERLSWATCHDQDRLDTSIKIVIHTVPPGNVTPNPTRQPTTDGNSPYPHTTALLNACKDQRLICDLIPSPPS